MGKNFESVTLLRSTSPIPIKIPITLPMENTKIAMKWYLNFDPWLAVNSTPRQKATTSLWDMTAVKRIITLAVVSWMPIASPSSNEWIDSAVNIPIMPARVCRHGSWWFVWQILALAFSSSTSWRCWCSSHVDVPALSACFGASFVPYDEWLWVCNIGCDSSDPCECWCWIASPQQKCKSSSAR